MKSGGRSNKKVNGPFQARRKSFTTGILRSPRYHPYYGGLFRALMSVISLVGLSTKSQPFSKLTLAFFFSLYLCAKVKSSSKITVLIAISEKLDRFFASVVGIWFPRWH